jgi:hypothetical protein
MSQECNVDSKRIISENSPKAKLEDYQNRTLLSIALRANPLPMASGSAFLWQRYRTLLYLLMRDPNSESRISIDGQMLWE